MSGIFECQMPVTIQLIIQITCIIVIFRPPSLSELTPYYISLGLTHLGLKASTFCEYFQNVKYCINELNDEM